MSYFNPRAVRITSVVDSVTLWQEFVSELSPASCCSINDPYSSVVRLRNTTLVSLSVSWFVSYSGLIGFWTLSIVRYSKEHNVLPTMDKVQKPSNPELYTPSSEPFRICLVSHCY
jgi:hypothetical protein